MTAVGISMVKDEADIIEATVRHMLDNVDHVLVADNGSVDETRGILRALAAEYPGRLVVVDDDEPAYMQSDKMTALAHQARALFGAEWVVPFDADEIWYSGFGTIAEVLEGLGPNLWVATARLFDHVATGIDDPAEPDPTRRITYRRTTALPLKKVACRWHGLLTIHQGNHGCDYDGVPPASHEALVVRHFPYRSVDQLVRKIRNGAAAYRAAGDRLPSSAGAHWRQWGDLLDAHGESAVDELFHQWYWEADPTVVAKRDLYVYDPAPVAGRKEEHRGYG